MKKILLIMFLMIISFAIYCQVDSVALDSTAINPGLISGNVLMYVSIGLTILFGLLALIFGVKYYKYKDTFIKLFNAITDAIADNKITVEQIQRIIDIFKEFK